MSRLDLGIDSTSGDRGWTKDPYLILTIDDPRHPLHDCYEPERYAANDPVFTALVETIHAGGALDSPPLLFPTGLVWPEDGPEMAYLRSTYAAKIEKAGKLVQQPIYATVYGNTRVLATRAASARRGAGQIIRCLVSARRMQVGEARELFSRENNVRKGNSPYQNLLIIKQRIQKDQWDWSQLVSELGQPEHVLRSAYAHLLDVAPEVAHAALVGRLSKARTKQIGKLPLAEQAAAIDIQPERKKAVTKPTLNDAECIKLTALIQRALCDGDDADLIAALDKLHPGAKPLTDQR